MLYFNGICFLPKHFLKIKLGSVATGIFLYSIFIIADSGETVKLFNVPCSIDLA